MITIPVDRFEGLVSDALDGIPVSPRSNMDNVAIVVDELSPPGRLFGLYEGIPLTQRGNHYSASVPDRITIYMATICAVCQSDQDVVDLVRRTVIHEVSHHFEIGEDRLRELGWS